MVDHFSLHDDGKNVLRDAMRHLVPSKVIKRVKQGFSSPDESWFRGPNLEYINKLLLGRGAMCHQYISREGYSQQPGAAFLGQGQSAPSDLVADLLRVLAQAVHGRGETELKDMATY